MSDYSPSARLTHWIRMVNKQFMLFAAVGLAGTAAHYLILLALVYIAAVGPGPAAACGALAGACINYWLNRRFTFQSERPHGQAIPRFILLAVLGALLNGLMVGQLASVGIHFFIAQILATLVVLLINFLISRKWIFQKHT